MKTRTRRPQQMRRRRTRRLFHSHPRIVSLFSGYGGLDMGVQSVIGGDVIAHVEFDDAPSRILDHHWPTVPNLDDVTAVDWTAFIAEHPELGFLEHGYRPGLVITGGFPCQDVSLAGLRRGLRDGTRSGLWSEFARAIDKLRPELVVIENVRGLLSAAADRQMESSPWGVGDRHSGPALRALGAVLGDLAELGYDAEWCGVRAADAGAPHGRYRVFIVARPANADRDGFGGVGRLLDGGRDTHGRRRAHRAGDAGEPAASAADADDLGGARDRGARSGVAGSQDDDRTPEDTAVESRAERWLAAPGQAEGGRARSDAGGRGGALAAHSDDAADHGQRPCTRPALRDDVAAADASGARLGELSGEPSAEEAGTLGGDVAAGAGRSRPDRDWGPYRAAVDRWERVTGRVAPAPTNPDGRNGAHRLAPEFVEWMMGLPAGHVTGAPITRAQQLKALGNGVVPQQAALALAMLLTRMSRDDYGLAA